MLSMLRDATRGWVAKILLFLLVISFAVWGVSGSMFTGGTGSVITVGETEVSPIEFRLSYEREFNQLRQQLGGGLTREQADAFGLTGNVITQMVSGAILDETAREMELGISQDKLAGLIGQDEAFRDASGRFSRAQLRRVLASIGMSEEQYVETRRDFAIRNQIIEASVGDAAMPDAFYDLVAAYRGEERRFDFVVIGPDDVPPVAAPSDDALRAFYDENLDDYRAPEYRKLAIVKLEAADIADEGSVTEEEIAADYEARKDTFSTPEKRAIQQLVFPNQEAADAAMAKLSGGMSFAALVAEQERTLDEVALGTLTKAQIPDPAIAEAAFAASLNTPAGPVDGLFGKAILNVTEIVPGQTPSLDDVRDRIRQQLALDKAAGDIFDTHDRLEDERAAGETLQKAAETVGLSTRIIEAVDRTARDKDGSVISDIPRSREVLAEAFETDPGFETSAIAIGADGFVWFDVLDIEAERQKEFEEVRDVVEADWRAAELDKAIAGLAETVRARLGAGEEFNAVIADLLSGDAETESASPRIAQQTPAIRRDGTAAGLTAEAISAGFSVPQGASIVAAAETPPARIVLKAASVLPGTAQIAADERESNDRQMSNDMLGQLVTRFQQEHDVAIDQTAIRQILAAQ